MSKEIALVYPFAVIIAVVVIIIVDVIRGNVLAKGNKNQQLTQHNPNGNAIGISSSFDDNIRILLYNMNIVLYLILPCSFDFSNFSLIPSPN